MKQDKVFVRHKNFYEQQASNRDREARRPQPDRKKYAEKSNKIREVVRHVVEAFDPLTEIPSNVEHLFAKFPKFFNEKSTVPEKDTNELLNEFVIFNAKKYLESLNNPRKQHEPTHSSSDPDWNSDDDVDGSMESRRIDAAFIEKVVEKIPDHQIKKHQILKRHEKEFLQDYFRAKRIKQQQESQENEAKEIKEAEEKGKVVEKKAVVKAEGKEEEQSRPKNIWSEYQEHQVNSFVDMGFMTKIQDNQEEIEAELADDNAMFCEDENEEELHQLKAQGEKSQSDSDGDDDIFGDQGPATTVKASKPVSEPKVESEKTVGQGTVVINTQGFSKIAEQVGLVAARCNWIISNQKEKYKVSSEYMDMYYRKEKIDEILPYISLNHSEFVRNQDVETQAALNIFRKFNARREKKYTYLPGKSKNQYKQKSDSHLHKK